MNESTGQHLFLLNGQRCTEQPNLSAQLQTAVASTFRLGKKLAALQRPAKQRLYRLVLIDATCLAAQISKKRRPAHDLLRTF
jgi:hypothetical protein